MRDLTLNMIRGHNLPYYHAYIGMHGLFESLSMTLRREYPGLKALYEKSKISRLQRDEFGIIFGNAQVVFVLAHIKYTQHEPLTAAKRFHVIHDAMSLAQKELYAHYVFDAGYPHRRIMFQKSWKTSECVGLAQSIWNDESFDRMPILADALEEAGCAESKILNHLRTWEHFTRGNWMLSRLLNKERY